MWKELRKFGLQYSDLPTMVSNLAFLLKIYSLNIDPRNKKSVPIIINLITLVTFMTFIYVYCISAFWFVFVWTPKYGELRCAIVVFSVSFAGLAGVTRWLCMLVYQRTVRDIVSGCLASYALVVPGSRFAHNLTKTLRIVKRRAIIFWTVVLGNAIIYILKSLFTPPPFTRLMTDCFVFYGLEPMFESPNFQIAVATDIVAILFTCSLQSNVSAFFITITGYVEAHILALNEEIQQLWDDALTYCRQNVQIQGLEHEINDDYDDIKYKIINKPQIHKLEHKIVNDYDYIKDKPINKKQIQEPEHEIMNDYNYINDKAINDYIRNRLVDIVKSHTTNINLLRQIDNLFRDSIATEFMIIIFVLIAILLGGLEKTYIQLPYSLMLTGIISLIGQRVTDAGYMFKMGIYDCKWYNFDVRNRKTVLMMLMMAHKDLTLSAGSVRVLNYVFFMSVIRFIYTAYTTLRTTM